MIVQLADDGRLATSIPPPWRPFVHIDRDRVRIDGHPTTDIDVFVFCGSGQWAAAATDMGELIGLMRSRGEPIRVSRFGVSALLHNGLVPIPQTVYEGVLHLSMGDSVTIEGRNGAISHTVDHRYPWLPDASSGSSVPDTGVLLDLLTEATSDRVAEAGGGVLMLSSGKDSVSLALALAEAGRTDVGTVTYRADPDDPEPPVAADIARRLGLEHRIVDLPMNGDDVAESLLRFFAANPLPGTDLSQIPYVFSMAALGEHQGTVLDGGGNDSYMGYPVRGHDLAKLRYHLRGRRLRRLAQRMLPVDSPLNYLARTASETCIPGRTPRMRDVDRLYPGADDISAWWEETDQRLRGCDAFCLYAQVNERYTHPTQTVMKQRLAAHAVGMTSSLPWADRTVADYFFNLPTEYRYDLDSGTNKVLLRRLLLEYLDYDADLVGKHYFTFDGARFLAQNLDFVWSEIEASPLWDPDGLPMVRRWLEGIERRPMRYHAILTVFMVSGWSNHGPHRASVR